MNIFIAVWSLFLIGWSLFGIINVFAIGWPIYAIPLGTIGFVVGIVILIMALQFIKDKRSG